MKLIKSYFNLIEILISVVVISILAAISLLNLTDFIGDSKSSKRLLDISQVQKVVDIYHLKYNQYPTVRSQPSPLKMQRLDFNALEDAGLIRGGTLDNPLYVDHLGTVREQNGGLREIDDYVVYYGNVDPYLLRLLSEKDLTILESEQLTSKEVAIVKSKGGISLGYIPIAEVNKNDTYFLSLLEPQDFLYENGVKKQSNSGGAYILNLESEHYQKVLISLMEERVMSKGFDGLFLDTVGNIDYYFPPEQYASQIAGFEHVLKSFKSKYPNGLVLQNRGFSLGYEFSHEYIDGIMWEGLRSYEGNISTSYQMAVNQLKALQEQGILVFSVIRGEKTPEELAKITEFAEKQGYINYYNRYDHYNVWPFDIEDDIQYNQGLPSDLDKEIQYGSYVSMGQYGGKPLMWQVLKKNQEGILLFATNPLTDADGNVERIAFDTALNKGEIDDEFGSRSINGSNNWERSDLRAWLNSDFLSSFNSNELQAISSPKEKVLLNILDSGERQLGTTLHEYSSNISTILQNYELSYAKVLTEKIFVPSVQEVYTASQVLGPNYYSVERHYWLRDPYSESNRVRYVKRDGSGVSTADPNNTNIGVRPTLYLKSGSIVSGIGTLENPYVVE